MLTPGPVLHCYASCRAPLFYADSRVHTPLLCLVQGPYCTIMLQLGPLHSSIVLLCLVHGLCCTNMLKSGPLYFIMLLPGPLHSFMLHLEPLQSFMLTLGPLLHYHASYRDLLLLYASFGACTVLLCFSQGPSFPYASFRAPSVLLRSIQGLCTIVLDPGSLTLLPGPCLQSLLLLRFFQGYLCFLKGPSIIMLQPGLDMLTLGFLFTLFRYYASFRVHIGRYASPGVPLCYALDGAATPDTLCF